MTKKSLNNITSTTTIAAGTGFRGSTSNMLNQPHDIFETINLDLCVADCTNDRIQCFVQGQQNGTTIVGMGALGTVALTCPTGIVFDGNGYLFIVDRDNHQISRVGPNGFHCSLGCSGTDSVSSQLCYSQTFSFDSYENMFVTDRDNNRIQKFIFASNVRGEYHSTKL